MVPWAFLCKGMISRSGLCRALDLRETCLRLGSFNPFSVQGNTLQGKVVSSLSSQLPQGGYSIVPNLGQGCLPQSQGLGEAQPCRALSQLRHWLCAGALQLALGQWLSCPCSTGRALKSPACWEVWLSIGMLGVWLSADMSA